MSMKRLAVIAAVSHFNGHGNHNSTTMTTTTTTTAIAGGTTMSFAANAAYNQNNGSGSGTSPQIGGLGLLHQQNLRSGANAAIGGFTVGGIGGPGGGGALVMGGSSSSSSSSGGGPGGSNSINGNVNVLLGGAMLSVVSTVLCVVCYCCHRNIKKRTEAAYRQRWMDNDANMEIYSVEQCYETSGLFMESSEGLAVPALSHEPPPSYDAVVAMQEESSQAARISPPPDYRSMNDVSGSSNPNEIPKFIKGTNLLGMKKVLSAQSCCSLQRAEAENLFQLGVVAAAAAAATSGRFGASALGRKSLPYSARDSAALGEGRFPNQPYYRGCPLCGKFRYDDSMSLSSDSGLDQVVVAADVNNGNSVVGVDKDACYCTPLQSPTIDDRNNNNNTDRRGSVPQIITECQSMTSSHAAETRCENTINNNNVSLYDPPVTDAATGTSSSAAAATSSAPAASTSVTVTASTSDNHRDTVTDLTALDLDSINDNGIIRLDMSKIIDKTGLPTYEAALKLESSGYV